MSDHDQIFAAAIASFHVVLGFARAPKEHSRLPQKQRRLSRSAGDDPRPWSTAFPRCREQAWRFLEAAAAGNGLARHGFPSATASAADPARHRVRTIALSGMGADALRVAQGARTLSSIDRRERVGRVLASMPAFSSIKLIHRVPMIKSR